MYPLPSDLQEGLLVLAKLSETQFATAVETISDQPAGMYPNESNWWPKTVVGIEDAGLRKVFDAIRSLRYWLPERKSPPSDAILAEVAQSAASGSELAPEQIATLAVRLQNILKIPSLAISNRAFSLAFANARCLSSSRIMTDLRPVFENSKSTEVSAFILLHNLQLTCIGSSGPGDDLYITLDDRDLQTLIDQLQRAQAKAESLLRVIKSSEIGILPANPVRDS